MSRGLHFSGVKLDSEPLANKGPLQSFRRDLFIFIMMMSDLVNVLKVLVRNSPKHAWSQNPSQWFSAYTHTYSSFQTSTRATADLG